MNPIGASPQQPEHTDASGAQARNRLLSAVICTYNRPRWAALGTESLCRQTLPADAYEIIVVDNAGSDETRRLVAALQERYPDRAVRYFYETRAGISRARNRGFQEAAGEYVAYLDDDAIAPAGWLETAQSVIRSVAPPAFGGPIVAYFDRPRPAWFLARYGSTWKSRAPGWLSAGQYLNGSNMVWRRSVLQELGGFDLAIGPVGAKRGYSEETELQIRLLRQKPEAALYYEPQLYVHHLVRPEKWRLGWQVRDRFVRGRSDYYAQPVERIRRRGLAGTAAAIVWRTADLLGDLLAAAFFRDRVRYPAWQNRLYEHALDNFTGFGVYYEHLRCLLSAHSSREPRARR